MNREDVLRQMISDYRKKIETYQSMVQEWERELGMAAGAIAVGSTAAGQSGITVEVQAWQFMGKSQPEAAKALLTAVGHPLTTEEIIEGIRKGGVEVGGDKYSFYSILSRSGDFARAKKNTWGLKEWPGMSKKKKRANNENGRKTRGPKKRAKTNSAVKQTGARRGTPMKTAVRDALSNGALRSLEEIVGAVGTKLGRSVAKIAVISVLRDKKQFEKVDGQFRVVK